MTQIAKDVEGKDRNELLQPKENTSNNANQRIPLVINWHRKFKGISKLLHDSKEEKSFCVFVYIFACLFTF